MMRLLAAFSIVGLFAGCAAAERQSQITKAADTTITAHMRDRYDLAAVSDFLRTVISDHPTFEGVNLSATRVEDEWKRERIAPGSRMRSADWVIYDVERGDDRFDLYFMFDSDGGRSVTVQAKRLSKERFQFLGLTIDEWVELPEMKTEGNKPFETSSLARPKSGRVSRLRLLSARCRG